MDRHLPYTVGLGGPAYTVTLTSWRYGWRERARRSLQLIGRGLRLLLTGVETYDG